jgi:predicted Rossmann fold flavoprotein
MRNIGHTIELSDPSLVPIEIHERWVKELQGLSFQDVKLTVFQDNKKQGARTGRMIFTHFGISGPLVINLSKFVSGLYKTGKVTLQLDLVPNLLPEELDEKLIQIFSENSNRLLRNNLGELLPPKIIPTVLEFANVNPNTPCHSITRESRINLSRTIKTLTMTVSGFLGVDKAVVTSGGVNIKEVDLKTMRSKLYDNLFIIGDMLDFDRPTGGFSLQLCWMTGYIAGESCVEKLN